MTLGRKLVVEFIGTFFLVFTVGMATNPEDRRRSAGATGHRRRIDGDGVRRRPHLRAATTTRP